MDKPSVYIETSIVSYLAARPSRDPVTLRNQRLTHDWWNEHRERYALYTSDLARDEVAEGDPLSARKRLALLAGLPSLEALDAVHHLAGALRREVPLPPNAEADAVHIALATVHHMSYLLTWDTRHIANSKLRKRIERTCLLRGYTVPVLCTPTELMGA
jgi:hypothetical protein